MFGMQLPRTRCTTTFALLVPMTLSTCGGGGGDSGSAAAAAFEDSLEALKSGKISAYVQTSTPKSKLDELKASWERQRQTAPSPEDAAKFREFMALVTAQDAEQQLFGMLAPQLTMIEQQALGFAGALPMLASGMGGQQAAPAIDTLTALADRLPELGLADEQKLKQAIAVVTGTARKLELKDYDAFARLEFPAMLAKADVLYAGAVDLLGVYGLSVAESLATTEIAVQSATEDDAVLEVSYSLFGGPRKTSKMEMARVDGHWVATGR
jgi:hypothetical protein